MVSYEEKIKRGLILYLREVHNITAASASLMPSEAERGWFSGCDTCGYGADEDRVYTPLHYTLPGESHYRTLELDANSIDLLPELLPYIDRAN